MHPQADADSDNIRRGKMKEKAKRGADGPPVVERPAGHERQRAGDRAGVWEGVPVPHPEFRAEVRRKLEKAGVRPIQTVRGEGYRYDPAAAP